MIIPKMLVTQKEFEEERFKLQNQIDNAHNEYCDFINKQQQKYFELIWSFERVFNIKVRWTDWFINWYENRK